MATTSSSLLRYSMPWLVVCCLTIIYAGTSPPLAHTHQHNHIRRRVTFKWDEKQIYTNKYREHEHDNGHDNIYGGLWHLSSSSHVYILPFRWLGPIHLSILNESSISVPRDFPFVRSSPKIRASCVYYFSFLFVLSHWHKISARCACQFTTHICVHYCALGLVTLWGCIRASCVFVCM